MVVADPAGLTLPFQVKIRFRDDYRQKDIYQKWVTTSRYQYEQKFLPRPSANSSSVGAKARGGAHSEGRRVETSEEGQVAARIGQVAGTSAQPMRAGR